ncbi:unnamed protein product [Ostreobium quekettii]|uniref:Uncharacterized protein n=1 Tax=Ostreobium quekettii TaxID=121088 RepID=A0A8S1IVP5_9CHLO|nr:unnamed protein product [Ostreobium quekettii]|eukprot:evm.model.scf_243.10 EVM.evm.TU.scf_243.10   scf_243:70294-71913(-)
MFASGALQKVRKGLLSLKGSPRGLYVIFALKAIESFVYFNESLLYTMYLTDEFGMSDYEAGVSYGVWGSLIVAYSVVLGPVLDWVGIRSMLCLCFSMSVVGRLGMATTHSRPFLLFLLYGPLAIGHAAGLPVLVVGIKRLTTPACRGFAFGLFYTFMNVAGLVNGLVFDLFRVHLKHGLQPGATGPYSVLNDGTRLLLFLGCLLSAVGLFLAVTFSSTATRRAGQRSHDCEGQPLYKAEADGLATQTPDRHGPGSAYRGADARFQLQIVGAKARRFLVDMWQMLRCLPVQKFAAVCLFTVNLKMIFRHLDATLPKYQTRAFGCDAHVGLVYSINPFIIICLVPIVGAVTTHLNHFDMIHYGSYLTALSPFWMVAFQSEWAAALFVLMLSLGEAIWSPRWYDYSMSIAPQGKEGVFTAMAAAPLFLAKLPTGALSGKLLSEYCPDTGACGKHGDMVGTPVAGTQSCDGRTLWFVVGLTVMMSPLAMLWGQRWLRPSESDQKQLARFAVGVERVNRVEEAQQENSPVQYHRLPKDVEMVGS